MPRTPEQIKKTRADFEDCKGQARYTTAVLIEITPDGHFHWQGRDPTANAGLKACLRAKGYRLDKPLTRPSAQVLREGDLYEVGPMAIAVVR